MVLVSLVVSLGVVPWCRTVDIGMTVGSQTFRLKAFRIDSDRGSPHYEFRLRRSTSWSQEGVRYKTEEFRLGRLYYALRHSVRQ